MARIVITFVFALIVFLSCITITTTSFASTVNCERYSKPGIKDNPSQLAYDSRFPPQFSIDVNSFKPTIGRKSISFKTGNFRNTLLPDGKLIRVVTNAMSEATARYKCDMKPEEVLSAQKS